MTESLVTIGTIATTAIGIITENPVLMVCFCGGLLGVGFKIIKQARSASGAK